MALRTGSIKLEQKKIYQVFSSDACGNKVWHNEGTFRSSKKIAHVCPKSNVRMHKDKMLSKAVIHFNGIRSL